MSSASFNRVVIVPELAAAMSNFYVKVSSAYAKPLTKRSLQEITEANQWINGENGNADDDDHDGDSRAHPTPIPAIGRQYS